MIKLISAFDENFLIGSGNGLPWDFPEEYEHFLKIVENQSVIFGRKSFQIFSGDTKTTRNFVVSHLGIDFENATVCSSLKDAITEAKQFENDIFICGGATIYKQTLEQDLVEKMYLSFIKGSFVGDTYFPKIDFTKWKEVEKIEYTNFTFVEFEKC
ncbi:MAG: hypothetical protein DWQ06_12735 [Calditrichaeota bacterium]|nr:MAG: hypothetical protein DWQ06_12735 [Calditrichota bacterium]